MGVGQRRRLTAPPAGPTRAAAAARRRCRVAARTWTRTARSHRRPGARVRGAAERGPRRCQVALDGSQRVLADGHDPRLVPLSVNAHDLLVEPDRIEVERDQLLGAQARGVGELEQRAVAQRQRRGRRDPVQQRRDLVRLEHAREPLRALRGRQQLGRVVAALAARHLHRQQPAQRGELARDRGRRLPMLRRASRRSDATSGRRPARAPVRRRTPSGRTGCSRWRRRSASWPRPPAGAGPRRTDPAPPARPASAALRRSRSRLDYSRRAGARLPGAVPEAVRRRSTRRRTPLSTGTRRSGADVDQRADRRVRPDRGGR